MLQWEDSFYSIDGAPGAASDFDIFLADDAGNEIYSFNKVNTGADPVEIMPFFVTNATTTNIKIQRVSGSAAPQLKYIVYKAGEMNQGFTPLDGLTGWGAGTISGKASNAVRTDRYSRSIPPVRPTFTVRKVPFSSTT